jgi:lipid A disaccharide synthetase
LKKFEYWLSLFPTILLYKVNTITITLIESQIQKLNEQSINAINP